MMRKSVWVSCVAAFSAFWSGAAGLSADQLWSVHGGNAVILVDCGALSRLGIRVESTDPDNYPTPHGQVVLPIAGDLETMVLLESDSNASQFASGTVHHHNGIALIGPGGRVVINDLAVGAVAGSTGLGANQLHAVTTRSTFDDATHRVSIQCDSLIISPELASALGVPAAAGRSIGSLQSNADLAYMGGDALPSEDNPTPHDCTNPTIGPDVIVGDIQGVSNYSPVGGIDAISLGTISCNIGNAQLQWVASSVNHPVIPQNLYRLKTVDGSARLEQIGQSWMKHAFTALSQNLCCTCGAGGGATLGIGCSDPYTSGRNGTQVTTTGGCGPKFEVDAHAGKITWPYTFRNQSLPDSSITRRCQILETDLDPATNVGALYFGEAQYVTPDDAASRNQNNNCSYRRMTISGTLAAHSLAVNLSAATVRQKAAVQAWKDTDPTVTETIISTAEAIPTGQPLNTTGRLILSAKATDLGGGQWHYEYALFNMNSDRGVSVFSVPISSGITVSNTGFHDVPYHSGDGFGTAVGALKNIDGTDWPVTTSACSVRWDVVPLVAPNDPRNTNYLRWGTLYNYRFDSNSPPTTGNVTLSYWKAVTGQPDTVAVSTVIPCSPPVINAIANQNATCGAAFTSATPVACGTGPFTWSIASGAEPGMTISSTTGVVSWPNPVPSATGYDVTIQATSGCSPAVDTEIMHINVPFSPDPVIDPIAPQNALCGSAFTSSTPTGTGLAGATWSITLGGQPGMTIDSAGVISWPSPVATGSPFNVTIQATNNCAQVSVATTVVTITVTSGGAISIDPIAADATVCGAPYTSAIPNATGGAPPYNWSLSGAPAGMTINPLNGQVSWPVPVVSPTPYNITLQAGDNCSGTPASAVLVLTVRLGDFDGDGLVNISDVPGFIDHLLGVSTASSCAGDMNADTFLDGLDVSGFVSQL